MLIGNTILPATRYQKHGQPREKLHPPYWTWISHLEVGFDLASSRTESAKLIGQSLHVQQLSFEL